MNQETNRQTKPSGHTDVTTPLQKTEEDSGGDECQGRGGDSRVKDNQMKREIEVERRKKERRELRKKKHERAINRRKWGNYTCP